MPQEFSTWKCDLDSDMFSRDGSQDPQGSLSGAPPQEVHWEISEFLQQAEYDTGRIIFRVLTPASAEKAQFTAAPDSSDVTTGQSQGGGRRGRSVKSVSRNFEF